MGPGGVRVTTSTAGASECRRAGHPSPCQLYAGAVPVSLETRRVHRHSPRDHRHVVGIQLVRDSPSSRPFIAFSILNARSYWCEWFALTLSASRAPSFVGSQSFVRPPSLSALLASMLLIAPTPSRGSSVPRAANLASGCRAAIAPSRLFAHSPVHSYLSPSPTPSGSLYTFHAIRHII
jgi:hypothetical protein